VKTFFGEHTIHLENFVSNIRADSLRSQTVLFAYGYSSATYSGIFFFFFFFWEIWASLVGFCEIWEKVIRFEQIWLDLGKMKILHPQNHSTLYGYRQTSHYACLDGTPKQCLKIRFLFMKRLKIIKRWGLCPQTPAFHTFMFLKSALLVLSHSIVVEKLRICFQQMFCFCFFGICAIFTSHLSNFFLWHRVMSLHYVSTPPWNHNCHVCIYIFAYFQTCPCVLAATSVCCTLRCLTTPIVSCTAPVLKHCFFHVCCNGLFNDNSKKSLLLLINS